MPGPRPEQRYDPQVHGELDCPPQARCGHQGCRGKKRNRSNDGGRTVVAWCSKCGHASAPLTEG